MRALSNVSLPRIAQNTEYNKRQAERSNETRLNQNFRILQGTIAEMELNEEAMGKRIETLENPAFQPGIASVSDSTNWRVIKLNTGDVMCYERTPHITLNATTASGSLYTASSSINFPITFSTVHNVQITAFGDCIAVVMALSNSGVSYKIYSPVSASVTFDLFISVFGKE